MDAVDEDSHRKIAAGRLLFVGGQLLMSSSSRPAPLSKLPTVSCAVASSGNPKQREGASQTCASRSCIPGPGLCQQGRAMSRGLSTQQSTPSKTWSSFFSSCASVVPCSASILS